MAIQTFKKDPDEVLDFVFDWSTYLDTDAISSGVVTVQTGLTKESDSSTTTAVTVWLSGGTAGNTYNVTSKISTAGGRTGVRTIAIQVEER